MSEEEKINFKQVVLDGCPVQWLLDAASQLHQKLEEKCGEAPDSEAAFRVGLITGAVYVMDAIGLEHNFPEFHLVIDKENLDS